MNFRGLVLPVVWYCPHGGGGDDVQRIRRVVLILLIYVLLKIPADEITCLSMRRCDLWKLD